MGDWSLWQYMLLIDIWFYAVWIMSKLSLKKKSGYVRTNWDNMCSETFYGYITFLDLVD